MMRATTIGGLLLLFSQGMPAQPAFEVASIRKSQTVNEKRREIIQTSPDGLTMRSVSMRSAIRWAYGVFDAQISGPGWMSEERFDITAKAAEQVPQEQIRLMLQALLAERFKLALHRQTKELQVYVLGVGKNGPKFRESLNEGESRIEPDPSRFTVTVQRTPVSQLVEMLSNVLRAPVLDATGLKGKYDVTLSLSKYIPDRSAGAGAFDPISVIMSGLQDELGLKLEPKKTPLDLLIVDHAEKAPAEN